MTVEPTPFPEPDHHSGYTFAHLKEIMGDELFTQFSNWNQDNTMMRDHKTGEYVVYAHHVHRFLEGRPS